MRSAGSTGLTPGFSETLLAQADGSRIFDLSVEYFVGMPSRTEAGDPPFQIWMTHTPRGSVVDDATGVGAAAHEKHSYASDAISMFTHIGTHIDSLNHMGFCGMFWNGWTVDEHLGSRGWTRGGVDNFPPIVAHGVLLDVAGLHGVDCLPDDHVAGVADLAAAADRGQVELRRGDVVLIRTGRMSRWPRAEFLAGPMPGIDLAAARYLCEEAGAMVIGADTAALEAFPGEPGFLPVHYYMFATAGAPIMEVVNLEELAAEELFEFAFLALPMRLRGATGAPLRPIAMPLRSQSPATRASTACPACPARPDDGSPGPRRAPRPPRSRRPPA